MANIYLRVPTYVAQFYRGLDAEHLLAEHDAYEFMEFQHEYWLMKNYLHLIPENQQTATRSGHGTTYWRARTLPARRAY